MQDMGRIGRVPATNMRTGGDVERLHFVYFMLNGISYQSPLGKGLS